MRVLDLGCGKALTSIVLAAEFGVRVWAADLWIAPADNLVRVRAAGRDADVFPLHAEAHALPLPEAYFDAVVSIDAARRSPGLAGGSPAWRGSRPRASRGRATDSA